MMLQTGSHSFSFLFLLFTLHLSPTLAYFLKHCTIHYSENVTAGVSVDCLDSGLDRIPDDIPGYVKRLKLWSNNIPNISSTDTLHLSNLTILDLSSNLITHVDDGAFVPLVQLKELRMNDNLLTTLTDNMFQGLSELSILSLEDNNIQFVDSAAFKLLPNLQTLSMTSNQIADIITILQQLPCLHVLEISSDELESFQSKDLPFNMTSELRELIVYSESIKKFSITTAVFPHLETIDLSGCQADGLEWDIPNKYFLRNITKVSFSGGFITFNSIRKALQSLDSLAYLQLLIMDNWIKRGLLNIACKIPTLRTLNLYFSITNLTEKLSPCTQLINLDLSYNGLTELSKGSIKQMKQLSHLDLSSNKLSKVPDDVKHLSMLQILDLRINHINDLSCSDFLNLTRLTHLHLDNNYISELKQCLFQHLNELKALTLDRNSIWTIGDAFKIGLQKLELLDLNNNNNDVSISRVDFINLKSLKQLDLGCRLPVGEVYEWDPFYEGLDALETLGVIFDMVDNTLSQPPPHTLNRLKTFTIQFRTSYSPYKFNVISDFISAMKNLEHFTAENAESNSHLHVPHRDTFKDVPQLKTLTLRNSNLSDLGPEVFYPIQNLESVDLSNSKLKSMDFLAQANLTRVSWLDLSQNELAVINVSVFSFLPALRYVNMGENPFACECSNYDFQQWVLNNSQTLVAGARRYTCAYPLAKKGTRLLDFDYHSCLVDASFICYISSTCVIVLTLLTSFTYHFLRLHLLYGYYLFLAFLYDATERKRGSPQRYDAFISYNVHDELWVYREMLPVLEGEQGWRLCLHHRDFPPGKPIIENITDAIYGSRKTICVISHHYLESEWCSREIQMASYRLFDEQKDILILVFLEDIPAHQLSPYYHMKKLVKRHTYLSWPQAGQQHPGLFWQNLRRAMDADTDLRLNI